MFEVVFDASGSMESFGNLAVALHDSKEYQGIHIA